MKDIENNEDEDDDKDSGTESDVDCAGCPEPTSIMLLTQNAKDALTETIMKRAVQDRDKFANTIDPKISVNMDLFIEDFGAEKLLPLWKKERPGLDYFTSSIPHFQNDPQCPSTMRGLEAKVVMISAENLREPSQPKEILCP